MRAMARTADGAAALVEMKAVDGAYPLYGEVALEPRALSPTRLRERDGASARSPSRRCWRGSTSAPGARVSSAPPRRTPRVAAASPTSSRAASASARACSSARKRCARPGWCSPAAWCAGSIACACPTPTPMTAPANAVDRGTRGATSRRRLGNPHARQRLAALERNIERFTQFLTLVGLTALLVGGVGVANAVSTISIASATSSRR